LHAQAFAGCYAECNPEVVCQFRRADTVFLLAFAIVMLNTDLHNKNIKPDRKMKLDDFVRNLRGTHRFTRTCGYLWQLSLAEMVKKLRFIF